MACEEEEKRAIVVGEGGGGGLGDGGVVVGFSQVITSQELEQLVEQGFCPWSIKKEKAEGSVFVLRRFLWWWNHTGLVRSVNQALPCTFRMPWSLAIHVSCKCGAHPSHLETNQQTLH